MIILIINLLLFQSEKIIANYNLNDLNSEFTLQGS